MSPRRSSSARGPIEHVMSAGGVVYRRAEGSIDVLLCGRREPPLWALPKGTPNAGESVEQTALREVQEETGVLVRIVGKLGSIRYWFTRSQDGVRCAKVVHHFLMEPLGGDPSLHDHEFDDVEWFPAAEALRLLTYANEATVLERAIAAATASSEAAAQDTARAGGRG